MATLSASESFNASRRAKRPRIAAGLIALALLASSLAVTGGASATSDSGVDFEDPDHDGQAITNQFAYQGVTFGKGSDHGVTFAADCGAPKQVAANLGRVGSSSSRSAEANRCQGIEFNYSGTFVHFDWPRKKVDVWVGSSSTTTRNVTMTAWDANGNAIGSTAVNAGQSASWNLAINHATADISGVSIAFTTASDGAQNLEIDDLVVDNSAAPLVTTPRTITTEIDQPFNGVVGSLFDRDPTAQPGDFTATIDWGDGRSSAGTVLSLPGGGFDVSGSHTWTAKGDVPITVTVTKPAYGGQAVIRSTGRVMSPESGPPAGGGGAPPTGTTPTPPTPPTPTPPKPPVSPAAKAAFTLSAPSVPKGRPISFDASQSVPVGAIVQQFAWDINDDGRTDATCDGTTPVLVTRLPAAGASAVKLTVTDSGGGISSALQPLKVTSSRARAAAVTVPVGLAYRCKSPTAVRDDITAQGGPPAGCVGQVSFGIVDAVGCFDQAPRAEDIPAAERNIILPIFARLTRTSAAIRAAGLQDKLNPTDQAFSTRDPVISRQAVRVNGLDIIPAAGSVVAIIPSDYRLATRETRTGYIVSSNATIRVGSVPLQSGEIRIKLPFGTKTAHVFDFDLKRDVPFLNDLPLTGKMAGNLVNQASLLPAHVMLPGVFTDPSTGKGLSAEVTLRATNRDGILLDGIEVRAPHVFLGGIALNDLFFRYRRADETYEGGGQVVFNPQGDSITGSIGFKRGSFNYLKLAYDAGPGSTGITIGPGVSILHLGGAFRLNPTELDADAVIGMGVASGRGCPAVGVRASLNQHFSPPPYVLDARGSVELKCIPLSKGFLHIDGDGYVSFGGSLDYDFAVFSLKAEVTAQYLDPHFQVDGNARACIGDLGCIGGEVVISDKGMGFCADFGFTHAGAGFYYPPVANFANPATAIAGILNNTTVMLTSCNVGQFRTLPKIASAARAGAPRTFEVTDSENALVVGVVGSEGVPRVKLTGPDGRVVQAPASGPLRNANEVVFHNAADDTEYFLVNKPARGTWTLEPLADSPGVAAVKLAEALPDPKITGTVHRRGRAFELRYRWEKAPGQRVRFVERAPGGERLLGTAKSAMGTLRFSPSDARGSARKIVAQVELDGRPQTNVDVARYSAAPTRLAKPGGVRVRRVGRGVKVMWNGVVGESGYLVSAKISDGRRLAIPVRGGKRSAVISPVAKTDTVDVRVSALRRGGLPGAHSRTVRLARHAPSPPNQTRRSP